MLNRKIVLAATPAVPSALLAGARLLDITQTLGYEMTSSDRLQSLNFNGPAISAVFRW